MAESKRRTVDIGALIEAGAPVTDAIRRGGIEAMRRHIQAGAEMVSQRDGKRVRLSVDELKEMLAAYEREGLGNPDA